MNWTVAEARRRFAEVLDRAKRSPQPIYRRGRLVGAVVSPDQLDAARPETGLFTLGATRFGRYGNADRQSAQIKRIARTRSLAKRSGR